MAYRLIPRSLSATRLLLRPSTCTTLRTITTATRTTVKTAKTTLKTTPPVAHASTSAEAEFLAELSSTGSGTPTPEKASTAAGSAEPFATGASELPLADTPGTDWSKSYNGLSMQPFPKEIADVLLAPIDPLDVEMKPGMLFDFSFATPLTPCNNQTV